MKVKKCLDCGATIFKVDTHMSVVTILYKKGKARERTTHSLCAKCGTLRVLAPAARSLHKR